jgi:hypothetical protein
MGRKGGPVVARVLNRPKNTLRGRLARSIPFVIFVGLLIFSGFQKSSSTGAHALVIVAITGAACFAIVPIADAFFVATIALRQSRVRSSRPRSTLLVGRWDQTLEHILRGTEGRRMVNWFTVELGESELAIWVGHFRPSQILCLPWQQVGGMGVDGDNLALSLSGENVVFRVSSSAWAKGLGSRRDLDFAIREARERKAKAVDEGPPRGSGG